MNAERLRESLRIHEGVSLKPYEDSVGKITIGIGRNLDDNGISMQEAYHLLDNDILTAQKELDRYHPGWLGHSDLRQNVLIEMCFNLGGPKLNLFVKMWDALEKHDYAKAAAEMLDSKWADQVGRRAVTLSNMMLTDKWPE